MRRVKKAVCKLVLVAAGLGLLMAVDAAAHGQLASAVLYGAGMSLAANRAAGGLLGQGGGHDET